MAYDPKGLRMLRSGVVNEWLLDTTDSISTATGSGYITNAAAHGVNAGRGVVLGDIVVIRVVGAIPGSGEAPAAVTGMANGYISAISSGAATVSLVQDLTGS